MMPRDVEHDCLECRELLQLRLDGLPVKRDDLEAHLAVCPACREMQIATARFEEAMRQARTPVPPPGLADEIVTAVLAERRQRQRVGQNVRRVLALAASLLLVLFLTDNRERAPLKPLPDGPREAPPSLRASVAEASEAVVNLTTRTADETVGQTRLLVPVVVTPPPPLDDGPMLPVEPNALSNAGQGVSAGLEPLTTSARRAFGLFLRDVPMDPGGKMGF